MTTNYVSPCQDSFNLVSQYPYYSTGFAFCQGVFQKPAESFLNLFEAQRAVSTALFPQLCSPLEYIHYSTFCA